MDQAEEAPAVAVTPEAEGIPAEAAGELSPLAVVGDTLAAVAVVAGITNPRSHCTC
jgi:hypothetical protein